ncbi:MAG: autotransporter domain-containing protein [Desulfobulbaceae bacterium]|nr:autotransporter domain-containing protein [Desulfobulbaceae bacterium]
MLNALGSKQNTTVWVQVLPKNIPLKISTASILLNLLFVGSTWAANLGELPSQTELQSSTGNAIADVCAGFSGGQNVSNALQQELFETCRAMVQSGNEVAGSGPTDFSLGLNEAELNGAIQNIATEEIALPATVTAKTSNSQIVGVMARISALQSGTTGFGLALQDTNRNSDWSSFHGEEASSAKLVGAASADSVDSVWGKWGGFANLSGSTGDKDATVREDGFDFNTFAITAGLDYRLTPQIVVGAALGYNRLNSDFHESVNVSGGGIDGDTYSISLYGLYNLDALYFNGLIGYARNDYDIERSALVRSENPSIETINVTASADTNADVFLLSVGGGYELGKNAWQYGPVLSLNYIYSDTDGYEESGAGGLDLAVDSYFVKSLTTSFGGRISYTSSQSYGVLIPYITAVWRHEFEDDPTSINSRYVNEFIPAGGSPTILSVVTDGADEDYGIVGIGVSAVFQNGIQAVFSYQRWIELSDINQNIFSLGIRMEF